ncbi:MAG TPA: hypothetical protein VG838_04480 [Opitutaceae bacterium]|nr:hypothetical protein [Opitutaceae bacterium]
MRARRFALWLALVPTALAADGGLPLSSPFLPAGAPPPAANTGGPIEYHGYMVTPQGEKFSIYNTAKKTATWVMLNDRSNPFVVRSHRLGGSMDQVTVEYQGSTLTLALKEAKIVSVAVVQPPVFTGAPAPIGAAGAGPATAAQPGLPAGASLEEWAAEVQRRRELRQQGAQAGAQAAPVPTVAPRAGPPGNGQMNPRDARK